MNTRIIPVGPFAVNCIVLWKDPLYAWVIDPGAEAGAIDRVLDEHGLSVAHGLLTHGHIDHIGALDETAGLERAVLHIAEADAEWAFTGINRIPPYEKVPARPAGLRADLRQDAVIDAGGLTARILATPGHTPGSVCLYFPEEKLLIAGDTLFAGSVGRTDLPGGDAAALSRSLKKLASLPADVRVLCGHGPHTSIERERRRNPFLKPLQGMPL